MTTNNTLILTAMAIMGAMGTTSAMAMSNMSNMSNHINTSGNSKDGFIVERTSHADDEPTTTSHSVWTSKTDDGTHTYELRMKDGQYTVKLDGKLVPDDQIERRGDAIILMDIDGGVLYEFQTAHTNVHKLRSSSRAPLVVGSMGGSGSHASGGNLNIVIDDAQDGNMNFVIDDAQIVRPKVMLGIYSGEPGASLREQLGIKGDAIVVESVIKGLAADKAGIRDNDIILSINGSDGISPNGLTKLLGKYEPGDELKMVILRKGEKMKLNAELLAYDAKALGHTTDIDATWMSDAPFGEQSSRFPGLRFFSKDTQEETYEKIMDALRDEGISEKQLREIEEKIRASLNEGLWNRFAQDSQTNRIVEFDDNDRERLNEHLFPESMHRKAEQAIRDAERLTMEYRDGQLLLKRHAQGIEDRIARLSEEVQESMPELEIELHSRLEDLEGRLNELEGKLDERMESLSGLIERLIERLDED